MAQFRSTDIGSPKLIDRRDFTVASALAILTGVVITVSGCGGGSSSGSATGPTDNPTPNPGVSGNKVGSVTANHGHTAVVTGAQLTAAGSLLLDIQGSADHPHSVDLSSSDLASIAANRRVSRESSSDGGHSHTVTFN